MKKDNLIYYLSLLLFIGFTACDKDGGNTPELQNRSTEFNILLTDAPIDLDEVNVDIQEVLVIGNGMIDSLDISTAAGVYNLLDLQDGVTSLIGSSTLTVDTIIGIRIILGENNTVVADGETFELKTPSAQQSGLKLKVCIPVADIATYDLTLDFDACKSVFQTGNGQYILKPRIKILNEDAVCDNDEDADGDEDTDDEDDDEDSEDEDDEDDINLDELPVSIENYLMMNYPDALIEEVELKDWCQDNTFYVVEVETEDGDKLLFFDTDGNFVQSGIHIKNSDIPQVVIDGIAAEYTNSNLTGNWSFEITTVDNEIQYAIKLNGNKRLLVGEDGSIVCEL